MKKSLTMLTLMTFFATSAYAKVFIHKDKYFIKTLQGGTPLLSVNELLKEESISRIKIYGNGNAHLISFSKNNGPEKLYSVDENGFTYAIEPFTSYSVSSAEEDGRFQFNEIPGRKYRVNSKGFFLY